MILSAIYHLVFHLPAQEIIGYSVEQRPIEMYTYGNGPLAIAILGGIHGQYERISVRITENLVEHYQFFTSDEIALYIIPNINPDSFYYNGEVNSFKRFNKNRVDLNRNWQTDSWAPNVKYINKKLYKNAGGTAPFSEPETRAVKEILIRLQTIHTRIIIISFHSARTREPGKDGIAYTGYTMPAYTGLDANFTTQTLAARAARIYAETTGYKYLELWTDYEVPGEFINWAGENDLAAFDVEIFVNTKGWLVTDEKEIKEKTEVAIRGIDMIIGAILK